MIDTGSDVPLRLYVDHDPGDFPDAILLSEATIAFAHGVRELAYVLDPSLEFSIGLSPSDTGSFWQNTVLRGREEYERHKRLYQLAAAAMVWFVQPPLERVRDNAWKPYLDKYLPEATEAEKVEAGEGIHRVIEGNVAELERQKAFQAFSKDRPVKGVGVAIERVRPPLIVPRSQFSAFSGASSDSVISLDRTTTSIERAIIVSPVLEMGTRRWRLRTSLGEIGASIKDTAWLERAVAGRLHVPMQGGIIMDINLEIREKNVDGIWRPVEYHVLEVMGVEAPPEQHNLFS